MSNVLQQALREATAELTNHASRLMRRAYLKGLERGAAIAESGAAQDSCGDAAGAKVAAAIRDEAVRSIIHQSEAEWWAWAFKHLSYKAPEQLEYVAGQLAFAYRWDLTKDQVIDKLLGRNQDTNPS